MQRQRRLRLKAKNLSLSDFWTGLKSRLQSAPNGAPHKALHFLLGIGIVAAISIYPTTSKSNSRSCEDLFFQQKKSTQELVHTNAYQQWKTWERLANIPINRTRTESVVVSTAKVPLQLVDIQSAGGIPAELTSFVSHDSVIWPRHPFNKALSQVPFHDLPVTGSFVGGLTASRSLTLDLKNGARYSIKLATDTVHEKSQGYEPGKLRTEYDVAAAVSRAKFIQQRDKKLGPPEGFIILQDVLTVAEKRTGRGYLLRDISLLDNGQYYLPAFAIPVVGREIARHNEQDFNTFWQKNYAAPLGKLKADLLLRYGLQMETPNAQNFLIQFDRNLRPTGLIVVRDIADSVFVDVFAHGLGLNELVVQDFNKGRSVDFQISPYWENSFQHFDKMLGYRDANYEALLVPAPVIQSWAKAHNEAFADRLNQMLPDLANFSRLRMPDYAKDADSIYLALKAKEGQEALAKLR